MKYFRRTTLTFAANCPVGQVRSSFHLPYSNIHLPLENCMFYNLKPIEHGAGM